MHKTIILPVVLYGCEAWYLTLREERRLRVFQNRIRRRIFEPKRDPNGEWRRFNNKKVIKSRRLRWADHVARMEGRSTSAGKRPLERPRRTWEDNIRMSLKEIDINTRNWVDSAQDRNY